MRGLHLSRQWKIIRLMESRAAGLTAFEIAIEIETPLRTVYRDLEAIQEAGFPVYNVKDGKHSYWRLLDGFKKGFHVPVTLTELMSLHVSRDLLRVFEGTCFQESIESLFAKVRSSLAPETIHYLDQVCARLGLMFPHPKDYGPLREIIAKLSDAAARKNCVQISYKALSTGDETRRRVDPYQVWAMGGILYLIGFCHLRHEIRTFAIDRIRRLTVLEETFVPPEDFSLEEYLQTAFRVMRGRPETVKIYFRPSAAEVVSERIWHPSQEIRQQKDGSVILTLEAPINYEIISWILGFGSGALVLEPASLKEYIQSELAESLNGYGSTK